LQKTDGFDAAQNHEDVEQPEGGKAHRRAIGEVAPAWNERDEHSVDGFAADPRLDAEPAARHECAQDGGDVGA